MKRAILVVSFGTSYKETREKTIEVCENKIKEAFNGYDFFRAYTSTIIIRKLAKRDGIEIDTPYQALEKIHALGYKEVIVQSLHIICGDEYDKMKAQVELFKDKFEKLEIGNPLLTTSEDYEKAVLGEMKYLPSLKAEEAVVYMGHGTMHPSFSAYCALEYIFRKQKMNVYIGTVEGYPTFWDVQKELREHHIKKVYVLPFMLVAGDHAQNDMASDEEDSWKSKFLKMGLEVEVLVRGLGENPVIQDLFVEHAKECIKRPAIKSK